MSDIRNQELYKQLLWMLELDAYLEDWAIPNPPREAVA